MEPESEISELIDRIRENRTDGASELARQSAFVLKKAAETSRAENTPSFMLELADIRERLVAARPAMASVCNIVNHVLSVLDRKSKRLELDVVRQSVADRAEELIEDSRLAVDKVALNGARLISAGDTVMTHSYSSTVVAALRRAVEAGGISLFVTRSGPGRTGERTVRELADMDIRMTFIDDAAAGTYMAETDKVLVGADRICADGSVVNGIGTYPLALAAEKAGVPFYVLCETLKFDPRTKSSEVDLEDKDPAEVSGRNGLPDGVAVRNPYFDVTPLELVTSVVTENGLFTAGKLVKIWRNTLEKRG